MFDFKSYLIIPKEFFLEIITNRVFLSKKIDCDLDRRAVGFQEVSLNMTEIPIEISYGMEHNKFYTENRMLGLSKQTGVEAMEVYHMMF